MTHKNNEETNNERLRQTVSRLFNDDLMIALAGILASTVILQMVFEFSAGMQAVFEYLNYFIIAAFVAEYILKLYVAKSRASFIAEPMHIFDLIIILLALFDFSGIGYVSFLPDQAQISPVLRLLRVLPRILPRVLLTFFLAGRTAERIKGPKEPPLPPPELQIANLDLNGGINRDYSSIRSHLKMSDGTPIWIDFQNITEYNFGTIEDISNIPHNLLETKLLKASFPRIDPLEKYLTMFLWDSQIRTDSIEPLEILTNNMLIVFDEKKIITLSRGKSQIFDKISSVLSNEISKKPFKYNEFTDKILYSLLQQKLKDYSDVVQKIEEKTNEFEQIPVDETSSKFLEKTFYFKKEILKVNSNLWHFQNVLQKLTEIKNIKQFRIDNSDEFDNLYAESGYLYKTTQNIKESLDSLIELHTNTVSYDMNRVMKVIAVITCLAVIPATVGGLLGVNLVEGNFTIKFIEIFFIIFSSMLVGIYAFYKMEWLK
ncbi:MAG: CorA family divalent cation transporter [Methanothrix sp.]